MEQAAQLDPVSPSIQTSIAWAEYLLRRNQECASQCKRVLELYPQYVPAHQLLGLVYAQMGMNDQAVSELKRAGALENDNATTPLCLDYVLARTGHKGAAVRNISDIQAQYGANYVPDYYLAIAWTAIGDKQKAEGALDRAFQTRSNWLIYLHYDPRFDVLRSDAHFEELLSRIDSTPRQ